MAEIKLSEKYLLSIHEANQYFGIGIKKMRDMAEKNEGEYSLLMGNRWCIIRPKFEEYLLKLAEHGKAVDAVEDRPAVKKRAKSR